MRHLADKGDKRAAHVIRLLDDPEYFLSAVLVGTNLAVIGCTTTFTAICTIHFGARGETVATLVLVDWLYPAPNLPKVSQPPVRQSWAS